MTQLQEKQETISPVIYNPIRGFGVYVHWPFCAAKCPYCDFNSHVAKQTIDELRFLKAYKSEISHWANQIRQKGRLKKISSIFFGGGTPSLMSPSLVEGILKELEATFGFAENIEISLEANPQSVDALKFKDLKSVGVNRLSIGVQSFNDQDLKTLGRLHDVKQAKQAIEIAQNHFSRFSFDLIYGRPKQTLADWETELEDAISHGTTHLSLYQLTIEPNTPYKKLYDADKLIMPSEELAVDFYELTQKLCESKGLHQYEVSNHAVKGEEARHNLLYWQYGEFLGLGAGAHGRVVIGDKRFATSTAKIPSKWLEAVELKGHGAIEQEEVSKETQAIEIVLMGMRLKTGISLIDLVERTGHQIEIATIEKLQKDELLKSSQRGDNALQLVPTAKGTQLLNYMAGQLVEGLIEVSEVN